MPQTKSIIAIPAHVWEQDKTIFQAWLKTRKAGSTSVLQAYKRHIAGLHAVLPVSICEVLPSEIDAYERRLRSLGFSEKTVRTTMYTLRSYWTFAKQQNEAL